MPEQEQGWKQYTFAMLLFSLVECLFTYAILRLQKHLPLNPQGFDNLSPDLAFNTAVSFTTNTNWQSLHRRIDHVLSLADGGAGHSQLRLGRDRHRPCRRAGARP